jgi:hypothetical protein
MVTIGVWLFFRSSFVSVSAVIQSYMPFAVLAFLVAFFGGYFN